MVFYKEEINYSAKIWYRTQAFLFLLTWNKGYDRNPVRRQCRSKIGLNSVRFGTWVERRLNRALDVLAVHTWCLGTGTKWCCVHTLSTWYKTMPDAILKHELSSENKAVDCPITNKNEAHTGIRCLRDLGLFVPCAKVGAREKSLWF